MDSHEPSSKKISRRTFIRTGIIAGILAGSAIAGAYPFLRKLGGKAAAPEAAPANAGSPTPQPPASPAGPFTLSVASGDPLEDSVVLWTRLAPDPKAKDGGMPAKPVQVRWEVAKDAKFEQIVKRGTETAAPEWAHSVHAEVDGLEPATWYYYRFIAGSDVSPTGRTKTLPSSGSMPERLQFAMTSCQHYTAGHYNAYDHMVKEDIDVVFFLGDYIYETGKDDNKTGRTHYPLKTITTLDDYRQRHAQYKADPSLQAVHQAFPWIVAFDDHEVKNNWGGEGPPYDNSKKQQEFLARRTAAFKAYYEHMPLRKSSIPKDLGIQMYRRFRFGRLAEFSVLDTRQYRTDLACGGPTVGNCTARTDPARTILGDPQQQWLFDGLSASKAKWNVLAQQVLMAQMFRDNNDGKGYLLDKWDGYSATRDRLTKHIVDNGVKNVVVLTGDIHNNYVADLKMNYDDAGSAAWGSEFVVTSVTSGGNGKDMTDGGRTDLKNNPHLKFFNGQRGYALCQVTPDEWRTVYKVVSYVNRKGAPIETKASFVVKDGKPGAVRI